MTRTASALLAALLCLVIGTQAASAPKPASLSPKRPGPAEVEIRTVCWHAVALADEMRRLVPHPQKGRAVCELALSHAARARLPLEVSAAVLIAESGMSEGARSSAGAVGPWQVLPRYFMRDKATDVYNAGPKALAGWLARGDTEAHGLAMYNAGYRPGPRAHAYARRVQRWAREIEGRRG